METLGDILAAALAKGTKMRTYDVGISTEMNGKKIAAIKAWRDISGMSLAEAKNFVEQYSYGQRMTVRMNEQQLGRFTSYAYGDCNSNNYDNPCFVVHAVKRSDTVPVDISKNATA